VKFSGNAAIHDECTEFHSLQHWRFWVPSALQRYGWRSGWNTAPASP
jgi:hypothetical protein